MKLALALAAALVACSTGTTEEPRRREGRERRETKASRVRGFRDFAVSSPSPSLPSPIPAESRQLVVGLTPSWDDVHATLRRYARAPGGAWTPVGDSWPAVLGVRGSAWGRGRHGDGAPAGQSGPIKREGDGRSPAGVFSLADVYGYASAAPAGARVRYTRLAPGWVCVDDPRSARYNQVLDTSGLAPDWSSAEVMRRTDDLYRWVVFVDHNRALSPGAGSCIFLHVWRGPEDGTAGCTAMARSSIEDLVAWLDPSDRPVYALLPGASGTVLAADWGLPSLESAGRSLLK